MGVAVTPGISAGSAIQRSALEQLSMVCGDPLTERCPIADDAFLRSYAEGEGDVSPKFGQHPVELCLSGYLGFRDVEAFLRCGAYISSRFQLQGFE